jgi:ankyrin repeat protein
MYTRLIDTPYPLDRLERMMSSNLDDYMNDPLFPKLPMSVIQKVIKNATVKISAIKVVKLCYAIALVHGIEALSIIASNTFDNCTLEEIDQLSDIFRQCPYDKFAAVFEAIGRCIRQIISPGSESSQFVTLWTLAENGNGEDAYTFFIYIQKEEGQEPKSETAAMFLKLAAERGHPAAMYEWGRYLLKIAQTQDEHQSAIEYLIHSAARDYQPARAALRPYLPLIQVPRNNRQFAYQCLSLQIFLMNINQHNLPQTSQALGSLPFTTETAGVTIIADNILRAVQVRQRYIELYADLVQNLIQESTTSNALAELKQIIFTKVFVALCNPDPKLKQFTFTRFIYCCRNHEVFTDSELGESIAEFIRGRPQFIKSSMMLFYWFAPIIDREDEAFTLMAQNLEEFRGGLGNLDPTIINFKKEFKNCMRDGNWQRFKEARDDFRSFNKLNDAIMFDDIKTFERMIQASDFDLEQKIENDCFDLNMPDTEMISLIQYAALQGARNCFMALIQAGAQFLSTDDTTSAVCAIAGQNFFIMNFTLGETGKLREELFRTAAKFDNMYAMAYLLQSGCDVNCADEKNLTAFHSAIIRGHLDVVKFLVTVDNIDVNALDINGASPLHYATWNDDVDIITFLVSCHGVDLNIAGAGGRTPLHEAVKSGFLDVLQILADGYGININCEDDQGITPFHLAAKRGHDTIVQFLKNQPGIDLECRTKSNETAADLAKNKEIKDIITN